MDRREAEYLEHQRWRWMRHDWKQWVTPALARELEASHPKERKRAALRAREMESERTLAQRNAEQAEIRRLRGGIAELKFQHAHSPGHRPHWDWHIPGTKGYRWYEDGTIEPKPGVMFRLEV